MSSHSDPLAAIAPHLGALGRGPGLPEALTGEAGLALLEWLLEEDVSVEQLADAASVYRRYIGETTRAWSEAQSDMKTLAFMRGYHETPRLLMLLQDAIDALEGPAQVGAMADYMEWLAARANVLYQP